MADSAECFRIDVSTDAAAARVAVFGEIDVATAPALGARLIELAAEGHQVVVVDFAGVRFIDSSGLSVLIAGHKRLAAGGGRLVVTALPATSRRLFEISGIDRILTIE